MTKDELVAHAKKTFGVELNKKNKLAELEAQVAELEAATETEEEPDVSNGRGDPIAVKGANGSVFPWTPSKHEEFWTFIYESSSLSKEEKKSLGLK